MKIQSILLLAATPCAFLASCDKPQPKAPAPPPAPSSASPSNSGGLKASGPILRIAVSRDGVVTADGAPITVDELSGKLKDLAAKKGGVFYYREAAQEKPHPTATKVITAVVEHQLPVSLSSKPDYSDVIDKDGQSKPR
jgi:hypothetical protein